MKQEKLKIRICNDAAESTCTGDKSYDFNQFGNPDMSVFIIRSVNVSLLKEKTAALV